MFISALYKPLGYEQDTRQYLYARQAIVQGKRVVWYLGIQSCAKEIEKLRINLLRCTKLNTELEHVDDDIYYILPSLVQSVVIGRGSSFRPVTTKTQAGC